MIHENGILPPLEVHVIYQMELQIYEQIWLFVY